MISKTDQRRVLLTADSIGTILVKKFGGIGSVVLATPMLQLLDAAFPGAKITVLVQSEVAAEVLSGNPHVDEVILAPIAQYQSQGRFNCLLEMLKLSLRLRKRDFDLVINGYAGYGGSSFQSAILTSLICGRHSVGYADRPWGFLYSQALEVTGDIHEVQRNLDLVRLVAPEEIETEPEPHLWIPEADREVATKLLKEWRILEGDLVIGMHPGSAQLTFKRWNREKFAALADRLVEELGAKIIMFGAREEASLARFISQSTKNPPKDAVGKTSLMQTAALIERCNTFISNDTGLMHIAGALNIPVAAIFGPTNSKRTGPLGTHIVVTCDMDCLPCYRGSGVECDELLCLERIPVDDVLEAVKRLIGDLSPLHRD